jgi:phosphatidylglycerol:prolipoprotein diacylglycerol transferase
MYPYLSDLFKDFLGIELPFPIYSFGAMVALGTLTAGWLLGKELDRYYQLGRLNGVRMPADVQQKGEKGSREKRRRNQGTVVVSPSNIVWTVAIIAVASGFAGAKVFHILENLDDFSRNPAGMIFSSGGFTFYGGLIAGALSVIWYIRKKDLSVPIFSDSLAPGLIIAYGIGRLGCHLAGDGDWGIPSDVAGRPDWIPTWLWAETYANNILGRNLSAAPVYPTPIYEFLMGLVNFAILWSVRKHPFKAGWLFSLYLVFNGIERYLIEQIRVNNVFMVLGLEVTQAEVIAVVLIGLGVFGLIKTSRKRSVEATETAEAAVAGESDRGA